MRGMRSLRRLRITVRRSIRRLVGRRRGDLNSRLPASAGAASLVEAHMRLGVLIVLVWLIIGAIAAGQRGYYGSEPANCTKAGTIVVTVAAGPLNYVGVNPKVSCHAPSPSN
jgi:hypothetical protein